MGQQVQIIQQQQQPVTSTDNMATYETTDQQQQQHQHLINTSTPQQLNQDGTCSILTRAAETADILVPSNILTSESNKHIGSQNMVTNQLIDNQQIIAQQLTNQQQGGLPTANNIEHCSLCGMAFDDFVLLSQHMNEHRTSIQNVDMQQQQMFFVELLNDNQPQ